MPELAPGFPKGPGKHPHRLCGQRRTPEQTAALASAYAEKTPQ